MLVVADTSPLNYLVWIESAEIRPQLYAKVIIPPAVHEELLAADAPLVVRSWANEFPDWIEVQTPDASLLDDPRWQSLDRGERAALALATSHQPAILLLDEHAGFAIARGLGLASRFAPCASLYTDDSMGKRFYVVTRDLHLYVGLFLSPFVLVFAVSVFYLVHGSVQKGAELPSRSVSDLPISAHLEGLTGRDQVNALRPILDRLGVKGEISFIRRISKEHRLVVPVLLPGRETTVDLNLNTQTASISIRETGVSDALIHLHKMPGPHNVNIRVNSLYMQVWRVLADVAAYGLLFLTLSGLYLWVVLRAERRVGLALLSLGALSFFGLIYAVTA